MSTTWLRLIDIELAQALLLVASATLGLAAAWFSSVLLKIADRPLPTTAPSHEFEACRRLRLRAGSSFYRWFEPLVDDLSVRIERLTSSGSHGWRRASLGLSAVQQSLRRGGDPLPWTAAEYSAVALLKSVALGFCALLAANALFSWKTAVCCATVVATLYYYSEFRRLKSAASDRLARIKQRLPYAIDLMALMMEAGATFRESLSTVVDDSRDHPLGNEFGKVLGDNTAGKPLHEALSELYDRLRDEDISEIVSTTNSAAMLGAPMSSTYLRLAEQMRLRRSQRAERLVGQAQTMITFPGFLIMLACMLTMLTPFLLDALRHPILQ